MLFLTIRLTYVQMYRLGVHLGHTLKLSKFLSYWVYGGWRANLFIINLVKTRVILKAMIGAIGASTLSSVPIWFINLDQRVGNFVNRYAIIAGEPYCSYSWICGTLTNYRSIFSWYNMLYYFVKTEQYKMRHRDKLKMLSYFGFLNHRGRFPGMGFVTSTLASWNAVSEFWVITIPCAAVVDSNTLSWNVSLPIAGNDESLICLNYYCFLVSRNIIYYKIWNIIRFKRIVKSKFYNSEYINAINIKKKMLLIYLYHTNKKKKHIYDSIRNHFIKESEKPLDFLKLYDDWEARNFKIEMSVFNTNYYLLRNQGFFDFFGISYHDHFDSEEDSVFYNDPYRLY